MKTDAFQSFRDILRAKGFAPTPWRIGRLVGQACAYSPNDVPACPYDKHISRRQYESGVRLGIEDALRLRAALRLTGEMK